MLAPAALKDGCLNVHTVYHTRFVGDREEMIDYQLSCVLSVSIQISEIMDLLPFVSLRRITASLRRQTIAYSMLCITASLLQLIIHVFVFPINPQPSLTASATWTRSHDDLKADLQLDSTAFPQDGISKPQIRPDMTSIDIRAFLTRCLRFWRRAILLHP